MTDERDRMKIAGNVLIRMEEVVENFLEKFKLELSDLVVEIKRSELENIGMRLDGLAQTAVSNLEERLEDISEEISEVLSEELGVLKSN